MLVPDAHAIGMIAVIRSLGRAGYPVHAGADHAEALGLASTFATRSAIYPAYDDAAFLPWLADYVSAHDIRAIVPSEGFLIAIRGVFERYAQLLPISSDSRLVYESLSKAVVLSKLMSRAETAANLPPTVIVQDGAVPSPESLRALGAPLFLKVDAVDAMRSGSNRVIREGTVDGALSTLRRLLQDYSRIVVQGYVPGQGTGAYFLIEDGEIRHEFANRCLHEVPHTGGFCSLRESWWHEPMMKDARAKIRHLGWRGVAMLEYRWDPATDRFHFIELNARFWAALHLALHAGVDFPRLLLDEFHGSRTSPSDRFPLGLQCRFTVPFEIGYVLSRWRDPELSLLAKLFTGAGWIARFLDPRIRSDLLFPGDRRLYWLQWGHFLRRLARRAGNASPAATASPRETH